MADERIFKVKIDGLDKSYKDTIRLLDVLNQINGVNAKTKVETEKLTESTNKSTNAIKEKTKALTDEEKSQKKLEQTLAKLNNIESDSNKEQIKANQKLKEKSKQLENIIKLEQTESNSIAEMKAQLSLWNEEWNNLDVDSAEFDELTQKIGNLNTKLKEAEASKGVFSRNVGNYASATEGLTGTLDKLGSGINKTSENAKSMLGLFQSGVGIALLFDDKNSKLAKTMNSLGKIMAIVGALQQANNLLLSKGVVQSTALTAVEKIRTIQTRALAAATALQEKNTLVATIAQRAFNLVAKANPYVLLATAILSLVGVIALFASGTDEATEANNKYTSSLDGLTFSSKEARDAHDDLVRSIRDIQIDIDLSNGKLTEYEATLARINNTKLDKLGKESERLKEEIKSINDEYDGFWKKLGKSFTNYVTGSGGVSFADLEEDNLKRVEKATTDSYTYIETITEQTNKKKENENAKHNKKIKDQNDSNQISLLDGLQRIEAERKREVKNAEENGYDISLINKKYDKMRDKAIKEANKVKLESTKKLTDKEKELIRKAEDDNTSLIVDEFDRRRKEILTKYSRQREDLQSQLDNYNTLIKKSKGKEKDIYIKSAESIQAVINNINNHIAQDTQKVNDDQAKKQKEDAVKTLSDQKKLLDMQATNIQNFYDEINNKKKILKGKNGLIDVDATKKNITDINRQLETYIQELTKSKESVTQYYDDQAKLYKSDSIEYKQIMLEKSQALQTLDKKIATANKNIKDNTKDATNAVKDHWNEVQKSIQKTVDGIMTGVNAVFDGINSVLQAELDDANEKYDAISSKYDEVVSKREESSNRLNELEEQAKNARGGRALILQEQINAEMEANKQLANQEKQLAKDKEKLEKEIIKKEKEQKRANLASDIANAIATTASAVVGALGNKPWGPWNIALASLIGAMGAVQVGVMTKQLSKLEDGGLLKGKRHASGGMRVEGTNIEVEGGEYVVNRESTAKNMGLIRYINNERRELKPTDINSFFAKSSKGFEPPFKRMFETGGQLPTINNSVKVDNEILIDAIKTMKIEPKVAVTDINNAQNNIVKIDNWTGL